MSDHVKDENKKIGEVYDSSFSSTGGSQLVKGNSLKQSLISIVDQMEGYDISHLADTEFYECGDDDEFQKYQADQETQLENQKAEIINENPKELRHLIFNFKNRNPLFRNVG